MRRILALLSDVRRAQLSLRKAPSGRLQEARDFFENLDGLMSGMTPTSPNNELSEVMTSADFTFAIQEFVQRRALPGYQEQGFAFEPLVYNDTTPNFLPVTRYQRRSGLDDMEYVGEKGQARAGSVPDATKRMYRPYRFEKQFDFSFEALRNDDMGYFDDTAMEMGRVARRTLEKYVSRFYTNAVSTARLTALGALYSTTGRLTTARISTARMAFRQRTNARGERVDTSLRYLVYHTGLADTVAQILASERVAELATNGANVIRGTFNPIEDPYIAGAAPNLPWYAFADGNAGNVRPLVLARLAGWPGPRILRRRSDIESVTSLLGAGAPVEPIMGDFESGNIVLKVMDIWGTYIDVTEGNYFDTTGAYQSSGTAP